MLLEQMAEEVGHFINHKQKNVIDELAGFVRKRLGLSFAGETREGEYWVTADVRIKNLNIQTEVCAFQYLLQLLC